MAPRPTIQSTYAPWPVRLLNAGGEIWPTARIRAVDLIDSAKRRCGLDDFGDGDFFEPLSRLLEACQSEARLNVIGKIALRADILRTLCHRLLMERDRQDNADIGGQQIRQPLFIVGLPRSGTTILHILLAADPANRAPLSWEVMEPSPPTSEKERERIEGAARNFRRFRWLAPAFSRVHPMGAQLPQECVSLMSPSFLSDQYDTMFNVPTYRAWFLRQDMRPAYEFHRRILQHLQFRENGRRWILKAPAHMFALPTLLSIYPDALFVQTHRAPLDTIASVSSLITLLRRIFSDVVDPRQIGRDALGYWAETLKVFMQERERLPTNRIVDISYEEIHHDPISAIRRIYTHFNWMFTGEIERRMQQTLAQHPREKNAFHHYESSDFGLTAVECAERFADYSDRFGYSSAAAATLPRVLESDPVI
ncbi:MAG: sulfotransferase [Spartobacteria bacterium]